MKIINCYLVFNEIVVGSCGVCSSNFLYETCCTHVLACIKEWSQLLNFSSSLLPTSCQPQSRPKLRYTIELGMRREIARNKCTMCGNLRKLFVALNAYMLSGSNKIRQVSQLKVFDFFPFTRSHDDEWKLDFLTFLCQLKKYEHDFNSIFNWMQSIDAKRSFYLFWETLEGR